MRRAARESAAVAALLLAATTLLTWPFLPRLGTAVIDFGDPLLSSWILAWDLHALATRPLGLFDANIFYPHRWTLAFSDHMLGLVPLALPAALAGGGPILAHNVVLLATFPLAGLTMFWLVRELTGRSGAGVVAGVLYAFAHYRLAHFGQVQVLSHEWLPLLLLALHRTVARGGRARDLALAGSAFVLQALSSGYHACFAAVTVGAFAAWAAAPAARPPLGRAVRGGVLVALAAALLLLPAFLPYYVVRGEFGFARPLREVEDYSARLSSYLVLAPIHPWFDVTGRFFRPEGALFPGIVLLALAVTGAVAGLADGRAAPRPDASGGGRGWPGWLDPVLAAAVAFVLVDGLLLGGVGLRLGPLRVRHRDLWAGWAVVAAAGALRRLVRGRPAAVTGLGWLRRLGWPHAAGLYVALTVVGFVSSLGPTLALGDLVVAKPLYWELYRLVPGLAGLRVPARFALLAFTGLAVLAGFGVAAILRRCPGAKTGAVVVTGLAALAMLEVWAVPLPLGTVAEPVGPADRWLAAAPPGPVVELPLHPEPEVYREAPRLVGSTAHWRPLVNGYSGFFPPGYWDTVRVLNGFPAEPAITRLRRLGVRYVVVYLGELADDERPRVEAGLAALPPGIVPVATLEETAIFEVRPWQARGAAG